MAEKTFLVCDLCVDDDVVAVEKVELRAIFSNEVLVRIDVCEEHLEKYRNMDAGQEAESGFTCEDCDRAFTKKQGLSMHLVHSGHMGYVPKGKGPITEDSIEEIDFKCPDCDKVFDTNQARGAHRWRAHGVRSQAA